MAAQFRTNEVLIIYRVLNDPHKFLRKKLEAPVFHVKSENDSIEMFSRIKSIILFLIHGFLIISLLVFTLKLLSDTKNEKEGIFKISVSSLTIPSCTPHAD